MSVKNKNTNTENQQENYLVNQAPLTRLITGVVCCILAVPFCYFIYGKECAVIVPSLVFLYVLYSYIKEKRNDRKFDKKQTEYKVVEKYKSVDWNAQCTEYRMNVGFEKIKAGSMKAELLRRFRKTDVLLFGLLALFLGVSVVVLFLSRYDFSNAGSVLFEFGLKDKLVTLFGGLSCLYIAFRSFSEFAGVPVIAFFQKNMSTLDFAKINDCFMKGKMLSYKKSGINLCYNYVVYYANRKMGIVEMNNIENVSRKIVRVKKFQNSLYTGEKYRYFAELKFKPAQVQNTAKFEIELSELQVQLLLDEFKRQGVSVNDTITEFVEKADEDVVI